MRALLALFEPKPLLRLVSAMLLEQQIILLSAGSCLVCVVPA